MKSFTAIISFICLVIIFQTCYSLKCHTCDSEIAYPDRKCINIVDDRFLKNCSSDATCGEIFITIGEDMTNIIRICMTDTFFSDLNIGLTQLRNAGAEVNAMICNEDGCNRKFKLPFPTRSTL